MVDRVGRVCCVRREGKKRLAGKTGICNERDDGGAIGWSSWSEPLDTSIDRDD